MNTTNNHEYVNTKGHITDSKTLSSQGKALIRLYKIMADQGYQTTNGVSVGEKKAYNDFELRKFREIVRPLLGHPDIKTVLDYGGGGSDWDEKGFDELRGESAKEFFMLDEVRTFEPARDLTEKTPADCVVCMDVLEHIFLIDVPKVIDELFSLSKKLLIINVACYPAAALLPNGENAHITVRDAHWWKGAIDSISIIYPDIEVQLICSETFVNGIVFPSNKSRSWLESEQFTIDQNLSEFGKRPVPSENITLSPEQILTFTEMLAKEYPAFVLRIEEIIQSNFVPNNSPNVDHQQPAEI